MMPSIKQQFNFNQQQLTILQQFQTNCQNAIKIKQLPQDRVLYYTNEEMLKRFLIARDFNTQQTSEMWGRWVDWHLTYQPDKISENEECIKKQLTVGKLMWHKHNKVNQPILYYRMKFHKPNLATIEESVRFIIYMLEKGINESESLGSGQICVIYDRRGYSKQNYDPNAMKTMKALMPILQDFYPERLCKFYVLGANWFYRAAYKVVSLFLSKKTNEKVQVLADDTDLQQFIDIDNIIIDYGGKSDPSKQTGMNLKTTNVVVGKAAGDDDEVEQNEEDDEELKKMAQQMYQDAGLKMDQ